ncbi:hypothetical protein D6B99_01825 [Arachidicoccus soli]|uniref:Uncharacterized protein n=1 Tax=Arachidicoccus soli TaxID=2341117 RepID=A0A386HLC5_9BACT|nr:hypothetical protein D6B99_01825 [Arachidicoccus soli]
MISDNPTGVFKDIKKPELLLFLSSDFRGVGRDRTGDTRIFRNQKWVSSQKLRAIPEHQNRFWLYIPIRIAIEHHRKSVSLIYGMIQTL